MRRRKFIWLLLTVLAVSLPLAGSAHAQYQYWSPYRSWHQYRSWSGDYPFRQQYRRAYKKAESPRKSQPEKASKDTSRDVAKGPLLVIISYLIGHPMNLVFENPIELIAIAGAAFIVNSIAQDGETTWFEGVMLLAVYLLFALAFFLVTE